MAGGAEGGVAIDGLEAREWGGEDGGFGESGGEVGGDMQHFGLIEPDGGYFGDPDTQKLFVAGATDLEVGGGVGGSEVDVGGAGNEIGEITGAGLRRMIILAGVGVARHDDGAEQEVIIAGFNGAPESLRAFGVDGELDWNVGGAELIGDNFGNFAMAGEEAEWLANFGSGNTLGDVGSVQRKARNDDGKVERSGGVGCHAYLGEVEGGSDGLADAEEGGLVARGVDKEKGAGGKKGAAFAKIVATIDTAEVGVRQFGAGGNGGLVETGDDVGGVGEGMDFVVVEEAGTTKEIVEAVGSDDERAGARGFDATEHERTGADRAEVEVGVDELGGRGVLEEVLGQDEESELLGKGGLGVG